MHLLNSSPNPLLLLILQTCQLFLSNATLAMLCICEKMTYRPIPMFRYTGTCLAKVWSWRRSRKRFCEFRGTNWRPVRHPEGLLSWPWVHCKIVPVRTCGAKKGNIVKVVNYDELFVVLSKSSSSRNLCHKQLKGLF